MAIDTSRGLDVRATPTGELRAERDRLQAELDQAPPDRTRWLERTVQRRQQAEQQLAATGAEHLRRGTRSLFGRQRDADHQKDPAARALAARQAERTAQAEVQARAAQQRHEGWAEDHQEVGHNYREVTRELALRSRQRVAFAELQQPAYLTDTLGPSPSPCVAGGPGGRRPARSRTTASDSRSTTPTGPSASRQPATTTSSGSRHGGRPTAPSSGSRPASSEGLTATPDQVLSQASPTTTAPPAGMPRPATLLWSRVPSGPPANPREARWPTSPPTGPTTTTRTTIHRLESASGPCISSPTCQRRRRCSRRLLRAPGGSGAAPSAPQAARRWPLPPCPRWRMGSVRAQPAVATGRRHRRRRPGRHRDPPRGAAAGRPGCRAGRRRVGWRLRFRITQAIDGSAWHNGHPLDQTIATVRWKAQQLAGVLGAPVPPLLCVHDTRIPWDEIYVDNVPVLSPARLLSLLRSLPVHMDQVGVMLLAEHARHQIRPAT